MGAVFGEDVFSIKVGDLVKWIGLPGADPGGVKATGPGSPATGIVVRLIEDPLVKNDSSNGYRIDVLWDSGKIGTRLYPQSVEVINESR